MADNKYFNRELSWIEFNSRVLDEALNRDNPLLERLKFAGITSSNFDEFFMVRVAGLKRQIRRGRQSTCPTGMSPRHQLEEIRKRAAEVLALQQQILASDIFPTLETAGISLSAWDTSDSEQQRYLADHYHTNVFPLLTPLRVENEFPFIENLTLHIIVLLCESANEADPVHAVVRLPQRMSRFIQIPSTKFEYSYTSIESVVEYHIATLFPGYDCLDSLLFRVTRDADYGVDEERDDDFIGAMEEVIASRQTGRPVRLEISTRRNPGSTNVDGNALLELLISRLELTSDDVYSSPAMLDPRACLDLASKIDRPELSAPEWPPVFPAEYRSESDVFEVIRTSDRVLHHPYESFDPVVMLISSAAEDPDVLAIKITLYRTSGDSPIIRALKTAAERGKQVTAFVEIKARFDEVRNISWAQELERVGVIVVHGIANLKVHAKACMIVRLERGEIRRYTHLSTGNYNDRTARIYSDIGYLTANDEIASDVADFFNAITGYSSVPTLRHLVMAPTSLKQRIINLIEREIGRRKVSGIGKIVAKLNSLADPDVIDALYRASEAGVVVKLNIRGICMLVPGVKDLSSNIEVISIVDRYLEHSRIFRFENDGAPEVYLASADWMSRNLERRVELLFPIRSAENIGRVTGILETYFEDTARSRKLKPDGSYSMVDRDGTKRAQEILYSEAVTRGQAYSPAEQKEFVVRRSDDSV